MKKTSTQPTLAQSLAQGIPYTRNHFSTTYFLDWPCILISLKFKEMTQTFPRMFEDISRNVWGNSPVCLATFPWMFEDISQSVWGRSPECCATFPGMFGDIPRNIWQHSPEYNIPPIPQVHRILFPVPVFLVLYIAFTSFLCTKNNRKKTLAFHLVQIIFSTYFYIFWDPHPIHLNTGEYMHWIFQL